MDSPITCRSLLSIQAATLPKSPIPVVYTSVASLRKGTSKDVTNAP